MASTCPIQVSGFIIAGGNSDMTGVVQPTYDEINREYGLNEKQDEVWRRRQCDTGMPR